MKQRKCSQGNPNPQTPSFPKSCPPQKYQSTPEQFTIKLIPPGPPELPRYPSSISKIISSYQQLLTSLNLKIKQLTTDLELTRQKLTISQTRYLTLVGYMDQKERIRVESIVDYVDGLEKKLVNLNAEIVRLKGSKGIWDREGNGDGDGDGLGKVMVGRANLGDYFNFQGIRENQAIIKRNRKNSAQQQYNSIPWEKALQNFADSISSPTKFKQKTIGILKKFIPHQQRLKVWPFIFQNSLGITSSLYIQLLERRQKSPIQVHVRSQIQRDISRSFNNKHNLLSSFPSSISTCSSQSPQPIQPLASQIQQLLQIFHLFRPDISYVQGMTYPAIILTIVVGKVPSFTIFSNLIVCNKFFRNMYTFQDNSITTYCRVFDYLINQNQPEVAKHLSELNVSSQVFLVQWFFTIFSRGLSLETTLKIWDLIGYEREVVVYRICGAIFQLIGKRLLGEGYEQTIGLIQSYWSYIDQNKLMELVSNSKLTNEKLARVFNKVSRQLFNQNKEKQKQRQKQKEKEKQLEKDIQKQT